jgi:hypothetical protein
VSCISTATYQAVAALGDRSAFTLTIYYNGPRGGLGFDIEQGIQVERLEALGRFIVRIVVYKDGHGPQWTATRADESDVTVVIIIADDDDRRHAF